MATQSLYLNSFKLTKQYNIESLISLIFKDSYNADEDKFILNEYDACIIDGYYITYFIVKELNYNIQINDFERINVRKTCVVPFTIDICKNILEVWGNKSSSVRLISKLSLLLDNNVVIEGIKVVISDILFRAKDIINSIGKMKLINFPIQNDLLGSCTVDLSDYDKSYELAERFGNNISQVTVSIKVKKDSITVNFYNEGAIVFYKSKEDISHDLIESIREIYISK